MKAYLTRRFHFSASHRLHTESLSTEQNQAAFGKCNNPFGHGHNYIVAVTFGGSVDPVTGMVANLADIDAFAQQHLLATFDLSNLNLLDPFTTTVPSTENLAVELHRIFSRFPHARLEHLHVEETGNNSFDFAGQSLPPQQGTRKEPSPCPSIPSRPPHSTPPARRTSIASSSAASAKTPPATDSPTPPSA